MNMTEETPEEEKQPQNLGSMIDELADIRLRKEELKNELDDLDERYEALERAIIEFLEEQKIEGGVGGRFRATITRNLVPTVNDWDALLEYMKQEDAFYLFEKRIATKAWRELNNAGQPVPGTEPFEKIGLSLRKR